MSFCSSFMPEKNRLYKLLLQLLYIYFLTINFSVETWNGGTLEIHFSKKQTMCVRKKTWHQLNLPFCFSIATHYSTLQKKIRYMIITCLKLELFGKIICNYNYYYLFRKRFEFNYRYTKPYIRYVNAYSLFPFSYLSKIYNYMNIHTSRLGIQVL